MKKSLTLLTVTMFLLIFIQQAHSAIVYDPEIYQNLFVQNNGGTFFRAPFYLYGNALNGQAPSDTRTENFGGSTASMTLSAASSGDAGIAPGVIRVSAYATMDYTGLDGTPNHFDANTVGAQVNQGIIANIQKKFINTGTAPVEYQLNASLENGDLINFDAFQDGTRSASYSLRIQTRVLELKYETSGTGLTEIDLSGLSPSDSQTFTVLPESQGYSYLFAAVIRLDTELMSWSAGPTGFGSSELNGTFEIASSDNPLILTASVGHPVPTPVPPSLLLMISGLVGIVSFRRYRRGNDLTQTN